MRKAYLIIAVTFLSASFLLAGPANAEPANESQPSPANPVEIKNSEKADLGLPGKQLPVHSQGENAAPEF